MPNTLNAQARPRRDGTTGLSRGTDRPVTAPLLGAAHLNHWPRATLLDISNTCRSFFSSRVSMERWGRSRPTQEIRWPEGKKEVKHRRTERCFLRPERHPIILWRRQAKGRERHTETEIDRELCDSAPSKGQVLPFSALWKMKAL